MLPGVVSLGPAATSHDNELQKGELAKSVHLLKRLVVQPDTRNSKGRVVCE